jgi:hypothetical protein
MQRAIAFAMFARVKDERDAARYSLSAIADGWDLLKPKQGQFIDLSITTIRRFHDNIDLTYTIRLFATYEAILRDFWSRGLKRTTEPQLKSLVDSIASRRRIDANTIAKTHEIREFRNTFMHRNFEVAAFDYDDAASALGAYLSWLPPQW